VFAFDATSVTPEIQCPSLALVLELTIRPPQTKTDNIDRTGSLTAAKPCAANISVIAWGYSSHDSSPGGTPFFTSLMPSPDKRSKLDLTIALQSPGPGSVPMPYSLRSKADALPGVYIAAMMSPTTASISNTFDIATLFPRASSTDNDGESSKHCCLQCEQRRHGDGLLPNPSCAYNSRQKHVLASCIKRSVERWRTRTYNPNLDFFRSHSAASSMALCPSPWHASLVTAALVSRCCQVFQLCL